MRNLAGYRFPHSADEAELTEVMASVLKAAKEIPHGLEAFKSLTNAERDYLVGCRLLSPEFEWTLVGRALLIDPQRSLSVMVNEEDHLRIQALTAGLSLRAADRSVTSAVAALGYRLDFASSPQYGFLAASYINVGAGMRLSAMVHLIGLAQSRRLQSVIAALAQRKIIVRGLFGETSRAIGAFAQISTLGHNDAEFAGACEYLMREERSARREIARSRLIERANHAREFVLSSPALTLADALRATGWLRWAASAELDGFHVRPREIDMALTVLEIRQTTQTQTAARQRAALLRHVLAG
jgi:protein arginine kinase